MDGLDGDRTVASVASGELDQELVGAALGAGIGAGVGNAMDQQEEELRQALGGNDGIVKLRCV